jgi:hypothetical protein
MHVMQMDRDQANRATGFDALIDAYKKDVDVSLIRENLRLSVDQRLQQLMRLQEFAEQLRQARRKARG